jgi:hypothetical protein
MNDKFKLCVQQGIAAAIAFVVICYPGQLASARSDPSDNAALLYYQTLVRVAELPQEEIDRIREVHLGGYEDDEAIAELSKTIAVPLDYAQQASLLPECDLGLLPERVGPWQEIMHLCMLIRLNINLCIQKADYQTALDRCYCLQRFARQLAK